MVQSNDRFTYVPILCLLDESKVLNISWLFKLIM